MRSPLDSLPPEDRPRIDVRLVDGPVALTMFDDWPADAGAESIFLGRTRAETHPDHGALRRLRYEAHPTMAERELRTVVERAMAETPCRAIRVLHAVGDVPVGAASVLVHVACGHRAESFTVCRRIIDDLKASVPIWKCEVWADGTSWTSGTPVLPPPASTPEES